MHWKCNDRVVAMREDRLSLFHAMEGRDSLDGEAFNDIEWRLTS
jgi:hypothetical protein